MAKAKRRRDDDPPPVGEILGRLVNRAGWAERMRLGRLRDAWPQIVGDQVASRSEPVRLEDGVLQVRADGSAWATELTLLSASIASKAASFLGDSSVREVRVSAGGVVDAERGRRPPPPRRSGSP